MAGIFIVLLYVLGAALVVALGFFLYLRSVTSRRLYVCPACGEKQNVELMEATHCNSCGAPFSGQKP